MKKLLKYVLLILIGVLVFLLTSFIVLTQVAPKLEHPECYSSGGKWATFPNGCVDRCGAQVCTEEFTEGCDCGADKCWNGTHCSYERVEMKEEISLPSTGVPNATNNAEVEELYFETISKGFSSWHEERAAYLITNGSDWESLVHWSKIAIPGRPKIIFGEEIVTPQINFEEELVIAVFQGTFGSGHGIEVIRIVEKEDFLEFFVKESYKSAGTPVETRPYHVVKTEKNDKKPIFPEGNFEIVNIGYSAPLRIMRVGETQTFTIHTRDYEVTITEISGVPLKAEFTLNYGDVFKLKKGDSYEARSGAIVKLHNITNESVEFELLP